jgi:eukaryotic-like serine/threonine-protein kinase
MDAMTPGMTPDRWRKAEPIFDRALDLTPEARAAYLADACAGDDALRRDVESLLAADSNARDFLTGSAMRLLGDDGLDALTEEAAPASSHVGPYRIVRPLGQGGMGAVYLGERADGQFEQTVALKLIRRGAASAAVHRRFLAERQILARLQHANIARLIDGGLTGCGQPWLAMEHVDGSPLLAWCDERKASIENRLELFEQVAEAVRYAHQNLVVHRDLKPSNILVTSAGRAMLLDFGIAKVLTPMLGDTDRADTPATETGLLLLTPEYAAPEQVRGDPITTATDVYALGAVLYELLSGQRVHRFERRSAVEIERIICEQEPEAPSVAVQRDTGAAANRSTTEARLRQVLSGDLDTIILTALRKDASRRYPTVDALLVDLRNYRQGLPIRARPTSVGYRLRKFVGRHRGGVAAAAGLVLALTAGVGATVWQSRATAREAARAQAVKEFLVQLFETADPAEARGKEISARELLARGAKKIDSALAAQPSIREELLADLARIHRELGLYEAADSLAGRAALLAREAHGASSAEYGARLTDWGATTRLAGHAKRADTLLRQALHIRRRAKGPTHPDVAYTLTELSRASMDIGDFPRANDLAREAMQIDRDHYGATDLRVARDLELMANLHGQIEGEHEQADSAYRAALTIVKGRYDPEHPNVMRLQNSMAANLRNLRRYAAAESIHRDVLGKFQKIHPRGHPDLATTIHDLAIVVSRQSRYAEAESLVIEAIAMRRQHAGDDLTTINFINDLGVFRGGKGDWPGAEAALRETAERARISLGPTHFATLSALGSLSIALTRQQKYAEAESVLREVVVLRRQMRGERPGLTRALTSLGIVLRDTKRYGEANQVLREAESIARENPEARKTLLASALGAVGVSLARQGRLEEAEAALRETVALRRSYLDSTSATRLADERQLGEVLLRRRLFAQAESLMVPAYRASARAGETEVVHATLGRLLATLYEQMGRRAEAAKYLEGGAKLAGSPHP